MTFNIGIFVLKRQFELQTSREIIDLPKGKDLKIKSYCNEEYIKNELNAGSHIAVSALCAIFCTQSNDFALGYPVLSALYGQSHPEYPMYLYLLGKLV